jgi:hypothetical protein
MSPTNQTACGGPVIKNFDEVKKQLAELSDIVNKFKSEQVQLKIVERIFKGAFDESTEGEDDEEAPPARRRRGRRKKAAATNGADGAKKKAPKPKGAGPGPTLELLIADGFFSKPRTLREIIDHSKVSLARTIKQTDMSGPLARFVRDKKLTRSKNAEGQFAYKK